MYVIIFIHRESQGLVVVYTANDFRDPNSICNQISREDLMSQVGYICGCPMIAP